MNQKKLHSNPFIQYSCLVISIILYPCYILKIVATYMAKNFASIVGLITFIFLVYDAYTIYRDGYDFLVDTLIIFFVLMLMSAVSYVGEIVSSLFIVGLSYPSRLYENARSVYREEKMKKELGPVEYEKRMVKQYIQSNMFNPNAYSSKSPFL